MGKISLYILLTLIYIGFSKSIISFKENRPLLKSDKIFDAYFQNAPVSVVLTDFSEHGFFLKSYFLKLRLIYPYFPYQDIVIQTSKEFYKKNINNLGMAIYQRKSLDFPGQSIPQPGGSIFLGDFTYGSWVLDESGDRIWEFHRAFRHFSEIIGWGKFRPSMEFYQKLKLNESNKRSFYGPNNEFGTKGNVTRKYFVKSTNKQNKKNKTFISHLKGFFSLPTLKGAKNE